MAEVSLDVGGRHYDVACRDGEEEHLRLLARMVDRKAADVRGGLGGVNEVRQLLLAALLLADELIDARRMAQAARIEPAPPPPAPPPPPAQPDPRIAVALERLAERVERVIDGLEHDGATP